MRDLAPLLFLLAFPFAAVATYGLAALVRHLRTAPPVPPAPPNTPALPAVGSPLHRYNTGELPLAGFLAHAGADGQDYPRHEATELIPVIPPAPTTVRERRLVVVR